MDHNQQQTLNSGLMRYRSAPSSYFTNLINSGGIGGYGVGVEDMDPFINPRPSSPETERILARFISGVADSTHENLNSERTNISNEAVQSSQFVGTTKRETEIFHQNHPYQQESGNKEYASDSHVAYEGRSSQHDHLRSPVVMDHLPHMKIGVGGGGSNSNLIRNSSSPAGLFAQISVKTGYSGMRGMGEYGAPRSGSSTGRAFSSSGSHSSRLLPRISEMREKRMGISTTEDHRKNAEYITGFPSSSWDDSVLLSDNFLKGLGENDRSTFSNFNSCENQEDKGGSQHPNVLTHHLSLPTSSSESSAMENLLHFQDCAIED